MDHALSSSVPAVIFFVQPTTHISFGFSFKLGKWVAMAEIWPSCSFGSTGVKIILWGVKNVKNLDYCLCSSYRAQFLSDLLVESLIQVMNWVVAAIIKRLFKP